MARLALFAQQLAYLDVEWPGGTRENVATTCEGNQSEQPGAPTWRGLRPAAAIYARA